MRSLLGIAACLAAATAPAAASFQDAIHQYLTGRSGAPFSGVVAVVDRGDVVFERAYGFADADLSVPMKTDMRFGIGSLTKPITATAAMRLVEKGKLALSDPICKYIQDCPSAWGAVTIEHLLSHTSGIPDFFGDVAAVPVEQMGRAVADTIAKVGKTRELKTAPGAAYAYSNFGYCVLAHVMELATGSLWHDILRQEVFAPAGMQDTEYDDVWRILRGRVRGYTWVKGEMRHVEYEDHGAYAAGGLLSSARDVVRFTTALESGRIFQPASLRQMTTVRKGDYALGWQVTRILGHDMRNHTGGTDGYASHVAHYDTGQVVVVLSNNESEPAKATACNVAAIMFGLTPAGDLKNACRREP